MIKSRRIIALLCSSQLVTVPAPPAPALPDLTSRPRPARASRTSHNNFVFCSHSCASISHLDRLCIFNWGLLFLNPSSILCFSKVLFWGFDRNVDSVRTCYLFYWTVTKFKYKSYLICRFFEYYQFLYCSLNKMCSRYYLNLPGQR